MPSKDAAAVVLDAVTKVFRHRPSLGNLLGRERSGSTTALDAISLVAERGKTLVLLGPNGSGKTTLLKLICGTLLPDAGRVLVLGLDTATQTDPIHRFVSFAVAHERSFFPRLTAAENLDFFGAFDNVSRGARAGEIERVMRLTGIEEYADTLLMKLSSGTCQRLGIARALLKRPEVLLLDEPTRSLDPGAREHFWPLVREIAREGHAVILASHSFEEAAAVADVLAIFRQGRLVAHRPMATGSEALRELYFNSVQAKNPLADGVTTG